jgi:hypothetical protein
MSQRPDFAELFSAAPVADAPVAAAPSPFCRAHKGKANSALAANAAHQLRMILLPQFLPSEPKPFSPNCHTARGAAIQLHPLPQARVGFPGATTVPIPSPNS